MQKDKNVKEREIVLSSVLEPIEQTLVKQLCRKYGITEKLFEDKLNERIISARDTFPVIILRSKLAGLEAIVKYLRENRELDYKEIGRLLNRHPATLAATYSVARKKMPERFPESVDSDSERVSFDAFNNELSVLEAICHHLKGQGKRYVEISRLLNRNQRVVWLVCRNAEQKLLIH